MHERVWYLVTILFACLLAGKEGAGVTVRYIHYMKHYEVSWGIVSSHRGMRSIEQVFQASQVLANFI